MAQALRTVWLEPQEDIQEITPAVRPRRRARAAGVAWRPFLALGLVAGVVGLVMCYITSYARIAHYDMERQALQQEYAQLSRECVQYRLEIDRLAAQPRLLQVAQAQGLELPTPDRLHYIPVSGAVPQRAADAAVAKAAPRSWYGRAGQGLVASLESAVMRLSLGAGDAAYAQD